MPIRSISEGYDVKETFSAPAAISDTFSEKITFFETISTNAPSPPTIYTATTIALRQGYGKVSVPWTRKYEPWPLGRDAIQVSLTDRMDTLNLRLSNIGWRKHLETLRYEDCHGKKVKVWLGFLDIDLEEANLSKLFEGEIDQVNFTEEAITITLKGNAQYLEGDGLRRSYSIYCPFEFKGRQCGYVGPDTSCSKDYTDCNSRGNGHRFGGFRTLLEIQGTRNII